MIHPLLRQFDEHIELCAGTGCAAPGGRKCSGGSQRRCALLGWVWEDQQEFVKERRTLEDFTVGLAVPGKLMPRRIPGGIVLVDTMFEMR